MKHTRIKSSAYRLVGSLIDISAVNPTVAAVLEDCASIIGTKITSDEVRRDLIAAIRQNLRNRKAYSFDTLQRKYALPLSAGYFCAEKSAYVRAVCAAFGISDIDRK